MKILWMKPILPFPPNQGTKRVTLQLLRNLSAEHDVVLFTRLLREDERSLVKELEQAVPGLRVEARLAPNRRSRWHRAAYKVWTWIRAARGVPPVESYTAPPVLVREFKALAERESPDLVVAEYWYANAYLRVVPVPGVLFAHDMEFRVRERAGSRSRDTGRGERWGPLEVKRERRALLAAEALWTLTEGDRREALALGRSPESTRVMPFGVDTEGAFKARTPDDPAPRPRSVLLFGAFQADFNRDALEYVLEEVYPALLRLQPEAVLQVAGGGLDETLRRRCRESGVTVLGEVGDVREVLLQAEVVLIPLRFGGGLRIRLLEALALECAVVGTTVGVLGMGAEAERDVLVGDTPGELAGQVARLMADPELRRALGTRGRRTVSAAQGLAAAAEAQRRVLLR